MGGIGSGIKVLDEELLVPRKADEIGEHPLELLFRHFLGVVPPDRAIGFRIAYDVLVFRRTSRVLARLDRDRATVRETAFAAPNRVLDQLGLAHIAENLGSRLKRVRPRSHCGESWATSQAETAEWSFEKFTPNRLAYRQIT